jgi:hypothetical protein
MSQINPNNPLKSYFRQPAIYLRLPSGGKFYPPGAINMPANGELPVYPMTAIDEITYRTPDALFNGSAVVSVIQSCVPDILDPWAIPTQDVDSILVSIRIASYGHNMEIATTCPACSNDAEYGLDLRTVLDQIKSPNYEQSMKYRDMEIFFKPLTYKNLNENNAMQFEEQKLLSILPDADVAEDVKMNALSDALKKITSITVKALCQSISAVKTPTALVSEPEYIEEMLQNCDRTLFNQLRDHIIKIKGMAELQPVHVKCRECSNEYDQSITLDMTNFFGGAS